MSKDTNRAHPEAGHPSAASDGSVLSVDDCTNGLMHMADDHPCCGVFCAAVIATLHNLEHRLKRASRLPDSISEALNSGDGSYKP